MQFLSILLVITIILNWILSFWEKKGKKERAIYSIIALIAIIIVIGQIYMDSAEKKEHSKEQMEAQNQIKALHEKINNLTAENLKLNNSIMQPSLEYYRDGYKITQDEATGRFTSCYMYRSQRPSVAIRNIKIALEFDKPILNARYIKRQIKGGITNQVKSEQVEFNNPTNEIICEMDDLPEDFQLIIEVISETPLKIISNDFTP